MAVWIGTSGWSYPHWRGTFYPPGLPPRHELAHASQLFSSLEINRSFYSLLTPASCAAWHAATPDGFVFALKGSRFITHNKKLRDVETALANFFASGPLALGSKLGPFVWQLPATLAFDEARLAAFMRALPRTTVEAARLAQKHDHRLKHGAHLLPGRQRKLRHAIEPRHPSFLVPAFARLARQHQVAIAVADSASWPLIEEITADFMYVRLHGGEHTYASAYDTSELERWAARIQAWTAGRYLEDARRISTARARTVQDVYVYFDNDAHAHAPRNARELTERVASALAPGTARLDDATPRLQASPRHR